MEHLGYLYLAMTLGVILICLPKKNSKAKKKDGVKLCPYCHQALHGDIFCPSCGKAQYHIQ